VGSAKQPGRTLASMTVPTQVNQDARIADCCLTRIIRELHSRWVNESNVCLQQPSIHPSAIKLTSPTERVEIGA
jgi:hypothetical protein